jgi:ferrous iron transport protein B
MTVVVLIAPIFFGAAAAGIAWGLIAVNLTVLAGLGLLINHWVLRGEPAAFIMELPLYHRPNARTIGIHVWQNGAAFLKKAGTIILIMSVAVWALSTLPSGEIETSYLAMVGKALAPIGALMGLSWQMMVALLTSFVAKENAIATLGVLLESGSTGSPESAGGLTATLTGVLTTPSALAFLVVQMLFVPCVATVAAIRQETKSWGWTAFSVGLLLLISLLGGIAAYHVAGWF